MSSDQTEISRKKEQLRQRLAAQKAREEAEQKKQTEIRNLLEAAKKAEVERRWSEAESHLGMLLALDAENRAANVMTGS